MLVSQKTTNVIVVGLLEQEFPEIYGIDARAMFGLVIGIAQQLSHRLWELRRIVVDIVVSFCQSIYSSSNRLCNKLVNELVE